jgi:hypothetical protein
MKQRVRE